MNKIKNSKHKFKDKPIKELKLVFKKAELLKSYKFPRNIIVWAKKNKDNVEPVYIGERLVEMLKSPCGKFLLKRPETIIGPRPLFAIPTREIGGLVLQPVANMKTDVCRKIIKKWESKTGGCENLSEYDIEFGDGFEDIYGHDFHSGNVGIWKRRAVVVDW